ncbi:DNA-processing protein DprA [Gracilibacillus sp. S3-1-1]|uniref:DNA-processing protein DprA n=1 Tax=Gracilibacillus pellucidus TaxID=3095368 RepID=A0ACC6M7M6_9BACI|nr:DNA-processing protein DprA [Gracilibacillus sp. S3-1-1]MDX8046925.1 DNA-processing protein DprA [Gracilibacillus sp. S3-1-1]
METIEWHLIHLHYITGNNRKLMKKILQKDSRLEHIYKWDVSDWREKCLLNEEKAIFLADRLKNKEIKRRIVAFRKTYQILTIFNEAYPETLKQIPDPPFVLYLHGNSHLLTHSPNLSVIGTRYPSKYAKTIMNRLLIPLTNYHFLFTSGMALGIDGFAHQLALENQAPTIAVLGGGFNHVYPSQHRELFNQIAQNNLLVSEYPPDQSPRKYHFPERNRIISGLSFATLVIEAKEKSGTLITVDQALDQGKEVFAVPGSILAETSSGCNHLIKEGARLVQASGDILEEYLLKQMNKKGK